MKTRLNEIDVEIRSLAEEVENADEEKMTEIEERMSALKAEREGLLTDIAEEEKRQKAKEEAEKNQNLLKPIERKGENKMEIRESKEYLNAYVDYLKTGDDTECRALLTENAESGATSIPVPTYVEDRIQTAWDRLQLLGRVRRSEFKGNVKVGVELAATGAQVHAEGGEAVAEEELALAIVELFPRTFKKWISFSDEVVDMRGEAFIDYIYDEITYQIAKAVEAGIVDLVASADADNTGGEPAVYEIPVSDPGLADFINAAAGLGGDVTNPVIITSRAVYAAYKALAMAANYGVDPFDGMEVIFSDGFGTEAGACLALVGDLNAVQVNFPNGTEPQIKYDDLTLATSDLVKVIGRLPVGIGYIKNYGFARIVVDDK